MKTTTAIAPKPSFLFNERIYTKLTSETDQLWAIDALQATALRALCEVGTAWSVAAIFFVANPKLSRKVRSAAKLMLENVLFSISSELRTRAADIVVLGMEEWLLQVCTALVRGIDRLDFRGT